MTQPDWGYDISCFQDEDAAQTHVTGFSLLGQSLARRLQTPQGSLLGDPDYGYDLLGETDNDVSLGDIARIGQTIDSEFVKDTRVTGSSSAVSLLAGTIAIVSSVQTVAGLMSLSIWVTRTSGVLGISVNGAQMTYFVSGTIVV